MLSTEASTVLYEEREGRTLTTEANTLYMKKEKDRGIQ